MNGAAYEDRPPRPGWSVVKRMALAATIIFFCSATALASTILLEIKDDSDIFAKHQVRIAGIDKKGVLDDVDPGGPQTILVLGSDRRFADKKAKVPARSDTIILIRLDPSKGATAVMNIPRDLRVSVPGHGTSKINAAYEAGGPALSVKTIRALLHIPISHVVNINFGGFRRAIDRLKCVFMDVDRKYYHSNAGLPPSQQYSEIDVRAGYQRLCGEDALAFVRFRHLDNDLVRAARQQDFLRQAKDQIGLSAIFDDRKKLLDIFGRYTQTDINGSKAILRLLKLAVESAKNPVQEVQFEPVTDIPGSSDLAVSPGTLERLRVQFMEARGSKGARGKVKKTQSDRAREKRQTKTKKRQKNTPTPDGLFESKQVGEDQAVRLATDPKFPLGFPVYYPKLARIGSAYVPDSNRAYRIRDRGKNNYQAYRIVVSAPGVGQYYGIQGMTWKAPPILDNPSETRRINGRKYELFKDGDRLRLVAWRTDKAVYWVSNTLLQSLTNKQMLGLAESLTRVGS